MSKNEAAWEKVFEQLDLLKELDVKGYAYVTADDLIKYREPRLMAKLDTQEIRPDIFKKHHLTIFPVKNGEYIIFKDPELKSYYKFNSLLDDAVIEEYNSALDMSDFQTLSNSKISSESQAIDFAYLVSLLKTFTGEEELFLTIRGRLFSDSFNFKVPKYNLSVDVSKVQIEVDAGYESRERIYIIEAKVGKRGNFHIRQLYYPFKDWSIKTTKEVIPIFFTYTNGLFYFTQFKFGDNFGDLTIVKNKCFIVNEHLIKVVNLQRLFKSTVIAKETIPYPQADDLDKVIDIVTNFSDEELYNKQNIAAYFEFDERQGDYYANAAIYLGFLERKEGRTGEFELTDTGDKLANCNNRSQRNLLLLKQLLKKPSFNELFSIIIKNKSDFQSLSIDTIESVIRKNTTLTANTPKRRASTVKSWLNWITKNLEIP